jgi:uncharacterized protein YceH (UPF0502 family)
MALPKLTAVEARILGCLLEKERVTPDIYPLSLHSLTTACNQSTNRDPVTGYDEETVDDGLQAMREKQLARMIMGAGSRVQKFRHHLLDHFELNPAEVAVLCVLLLRGPQTPGELRTRTERMHAFASLEQVDACLAELARGDDPLVQMLPAGPGQKERRFAERLSAERPPTDSSAAVTSAIAEPPAWKIADDKVAALVQEVASLKSDLAQLREEFATFRKQFE